MTTWTWADDYRTAYAPTSDPRVLAIIRRQDDTEAPDGDVFAPAYWVDRGQPSRVGATCRDNASDEIAEAYADALAYYVNWHHSHGRRLPVDPRDLAARYLRAFHDADVAEVSSTIHQGTTVRIFDTPTWREHVGIVDGPPSWHVSSVTAPGEGMATSEHVGTEAEARACHLLEHSEPGRYVTVARRATRLDGDVETWQAALDGDVFGIGYAVIQDGLELDALEGDVDLDDFDVELEVWGHYGEEYAQSEAMGLAEHMIPKVAAAAEAAEAARAAEAAADAAVIAALEAAETARREHRAALLADLDNLEGELKALIPRIARGATTARDAERLARFTQAQWPAVRELIAGGGV